MSDQADTLSPPVMHTDGTVFAVYTSISANNAFLVGVEPTTGQENFRVPMDQSANVSSCSGDICTGFNYNEVSPPTVLAAPIVAGDGYAYVPYEYVTNSIQMTGLWVCYGMSYIGTQDLVAHLMLLRVGSDGSSSKIDVKDWKSTVAFQDYWNSCSPPSLTVQNGIIPNLQPLPIITNADQGVVLGWQADFPDYCTTQSYPVFCGGEVPGISAFLLFVKRGVQHGGSAGKAHGVHGSIIP